MGLSLYAQYHRQTHGEKSRTSHSVWVNRTGTKTIDGKPGFYTQVEIEEGVEEGGDGSGGREGCTVGRDGGGGQVRNLEFYAHVSQFTGRLQFGLVRTKINLYTTFTCLLIPKIERNYGGGTDPNFVDFFC